MVKNLFVKSKKMMASLTLMMAITAFSAVSAFAANADLDGVTTSLTTGAGDMKTNFLTLIAVIIPIIIVVFGIGWLIVLFKKKMSKAS